MIIFWYYYADFTMSNTKLKHYLNLASDQIDWTFDDKNLYFNLG